MKITIVGLSKSDKTESTGIRANLLETTEEMIDRAVKKLYGKRYFFNRDNGLTGGYYGQIFEALRPTKNNSQPGNSSATGRVRIDIE
jgi:hypothetical protein